MTKINFPVFKTISLINKPCHTKPVIISVKVDRARNSAEYT